MCAPPVVKRYLNKISGPLLDRIDLHVEVTPVSYEELAKYEKPQEQSIDIAQRVIEARKIQVERFKEQPNIYCNAQMPSRMVREVCQVRAGRHYTPQNSDEKITAFCARI